MFLKQKMLSFFYNEIKFKNGEISSMFQRKHDKNISCKLKILTFNVFNFNQFCRKDIEKSYTIT